MKKIIMTLLMSALPVLAVASGGAMKNYAMDINLDNKASLQRGVKLFVNYCLSCHSAAYMRYNRMGKDLGLSEAQVMNNLMFASDKIGQTMTVAMTKRDAVNWFGTAVPDLSVVARSRGPDWLYTYLMTFYEDGSRPFGMNNRRFPDVGMPHVLWELEGIKKPVYEMHKDEYGKDVKKFVKFDMVQPGKLSKVEYDAAVRDLVNYMVYMGEPAKLERYTIGIWVLVFLGVLLVVSYGLKKEYWKDVH